MDRVNLNSRCHIKPCLLKTERQATGPSKEVNADWAGRQWMP